MRRNGSATLLEKANAKRKSRRRDGFDCRDVKQGAKDGPFGQVAVAAERDVNAAAEEQGVFGMADFVNVAAGKPHAERLEGTTGQGISQDVGAHA